MFLWNVLRKKMKNLLAGMLLFTCVLAFLRLTGRSGDHGRLAKRLARVQGWCRRSGDAAKWSGLPWLWEDNDWSFLVSGRHRVAACLIPKVATTTLLHDIFLPLSSSPNGTIDWEDKKSYMPYLHGELGREFAYGNAAVDFPSLVEHLRESGTFSFLFVRHPYERLVSAFRDKILGQRKKTSYKILASQLDHNFTKFVDFVMSVNDGESCDLVGGKCAMDHHYRPYYSWCALCNVPYGFVGKSETYAEDIQVLRRMVLSRRRPQDWTESASPLRRSLNEGEEASGDVAKELFSQLGWERRKRLYEMYRLDFEIFGYSPDGYG